MEGSRTIKSVSADLARFASGLTIGAMPPAVRDVVRASITDAVGVIMAGAALGADSRAFVDLAQAQGGSGATLLGHRAPVAPAFAAFGNGALGHALDFEETHDATLVHPAASVVPAVLAVAEARGASGADVMAAVCAGSETSVRIGQSFVGNVQAGTSFFVIPLIGAMGAAVGAGRILGLTSAQMEQAIALAIGQVVGSKAVLTDPASSIREVRDGFNAKAGVIAAELALRGVSGFASPLEAEHGYYDMFAKREFNPVAFDGLGERFEMADMSFKPWPACRGAHVFIEMALSLMTEHDLSPKDIAGVEVGVSPFFETLCEPEELRKRPPNAASAKFSIPFSVASAVVRGGVDLDSFSDAARGDPAILFLAGRVAHRVLDLPQDRSTSGTLALVTQGGARFEAALDQPMGHPTRPMTAAALEDKFRACAGQAPMPPDTRQIDAFLSAMAALEDAPDIGKIIATL